MTVQTFDDEPQEDPNSREDSAEQEEGPDLGEELDPGALVHDMEDNTDSDEEGEDVADYEKDGFVVDAEEDELDMNTLPDSEEDTKTKKKKKRKRKQDFILDDDDLELLEENGEVRRLKQFNIWTVERKLEPWK